MSTTTKTFTYTDAKYLGSKIAADLHQLQRFYGSPSDTQITNYVEEFVLLVKEGYLESVDYGFKKNNAWIVGVSYEVTGFNNLDDNPGRVPPNRDISGASWGSYLRKSAKFYALSPTQQSLVEAGLPIDRGSASDPQWGLSYQYDKTYGSGDVGIKRKTFN